MVQENRELSHLTPPLVDLLDRVSNAIRNFSGAVELYIFGSAVDATTCDAYSDLDLQVITDQFTASRSTWPWILKQAGRIALAYPVSEKPQESAFCIVLENESPFHKIDIGLCDRQNEQGYLSQVDKKILLWRQKAKSEPLVMSPNDAFMPKPGTALHFLIGELLGSIRYIKARKRGQHRTCWRFLSATVNAYLRCYRWNGDPAHFPVAPLNTWDFAALDRSLPENERLELLAGLHLNSPREMDIALLEITRKIAVCISPDYVIADT